MPTIEGKIPVDRPGQEIVSRDGPMPGRSSEKMRARHAKKRGSSRRDRKNPVMRKGKR